MCTAGSFSATPHFNSRPYGCFAHFLYRPPSQKEVVSTIVQMLKRGDGLRPLQAAYTQCSGPLVAATSITWVVGGSGL